MKVYFDNRFSQWCAEEYKDGILTACWRDTKEEAIKEFKEQIKDNHGEKWEQSK